MGKHFVPYLHGLNLGLLGKRIFRIVVSGVVNGRHHAESESGWNGGKEASDSESFGTDLDMLYVSFRPSGEQETKA
jgi:hypothetical protein